MRIEMVELGNEKVEFFEVECERGIARIDRSEMRKETVELLESGHEVVGRGQSSTDHRDNADTSLSRRLSNVCQVPSSCRTHSRRSSPSRIAIEHVVEQSRLFGSVRALGEVTIVMLVSLNCSVLVTRHAIQIGQSL